MSSLGTTPSFLLPPALYAEHDALQSGMCYGLSEKAVLGRRLGSVISKVFSTLLDSVVLWISLGAFGDSCSGSVPSHHLVHSWLPQWWVVWGAEKALTLCKSCSAIPETPLCYHPCFQYQSKAQLHTSHCGKNKLYLSWDTTATKFLTECTTFRHVGDVFCFKRKCKIWSCLTGYIFAF